MAFELNPSSSPPSEQASRDLADIRAATAGDGPAGERLAERLLSVPRILAALNARRMLRWTKHDLEDLSQEVVARVWSKLDQFQGHGSLEAWLYRFCIFEVQNQARLRRRRQTVVGGLSVDPAEEIRPGAADDEMLELMLAELGPPDADLIRSKFFDRATFEELGRRFNLPPSTVKTRYYRGLDWLRRRLLAQRQENR